MYTHDVVPIRVPHLIVSALLDRSDALIVQPGRELQRRHGQRGGAVLEAGEGAVDVAADLEGGQADCVRVQLVGELGELDQELVRVSAAEVEG